MEGLRVWLALGCRGLGVHGEEGLGTVIKVLPEQGQLRVKWDESGAEHEYSCGMYKVMSSFLPTQKPAGPLALRPSHSLHARMLDGQDVDAHQ